MAHLTTGLSQHHVVHHHIALPHRLPAPSPCTDRSPQDTKSGALIGAADRGMPGKAGEVRMPKPLRNDTQLMAEAAMDPNDTRRRLAQAHATA